MMVRGHMISNVAWLQAGMYLRLRIAGITDASSAYVVCDVHSAPLGSQAGAQTSRCSMVLPCIAGGLTVCEKYELATGRCYQFDHRGLVVLLWEA
jgi:hypothetical protein